MVKALCFPRYHETLREANLHGPEQIETILNGAKAGIDHLHALEIIHVDLNEGNVMLEEDGGPVIIEFDTTRYDGEHVTTGMPKKGQCCAVKETDGRSLENLGKFIREKYYGRWQWRSSDFVLLF